MILNRIIIFRQFFSSNKSLNNILKLKCFSTVPKNEKKKIKEIKEFVLNQNKLDSNANDLKKPVLIYSNENFNFHRKLFAVNVCQFFFWIYLANFSIALALKKHKPEAKDKESEKGYLSRNYENFIWMWNNHKNQLLLSIALLICGQITISLFSLLTIRSVRYLILSPGARKVRITTFSITGSPNRYRNYDIPLENVSSFAHRNAAGSYIPIKVKGKWFYFLIDSKGQFFKPTLFDQTVGVFRVLK